MPLPRRFAFFSRHFHAATAFIDDFADITDTPPPPLSFYAFFFRRRFATIAAAAPRVYFMPFFVRAAFSSFFADD